MDYEVTLTPEEFQVLYDAMELANHPYTHEDVPRLVRLEEKSWDILQAAKARAEG